MTDKNNDGLRETTDSMLYADSELTELEMPEDLQKVFFYALDEAAAKIEQGGELVPFTVTLAGEDLFVDTHPGDEEEERYASAAEAVNMIAHLAEAYVFCYDGFIETDDGEYDMIIAEVGEKGSDVADAYGLVYALDEEAGTVEFDEGLLALGETENLFDPEAVAAAEALAQAYSEAEAESDED